MRDEHQPMLPPDVPISGLCDLQTGVKFLLSHFHFEEL
jgi:hypothetical protein